ncbi:hypothetical protein LTR59_012241 [Friedmanniomyces endolithicus]|nr:hypothetical protein LTR59_012241 [Friedmanniomyces endolithicus]
MIEIEALVESNQIAHRLLAARPQVTHHFAEHPGLRFDVVDAIGILHEPNMPLTTIHLIALSPNATINQFLRALKSFGVKPLVASRAVRWIIRPEHLSTSQLLDTQWDLLIILPASSPLPETYLNKDWVRAHWTITAGVPGTLLQDFETKNNRLLHPQKDDVPPLTGSLENQPRKASSAQGLELNDDLLTWSRTFALGQQGAVSMLNLLAFHPGKEMHASYLRYGKAFSESIGKRRGGLAKIVGKVVAGQGTEGEDVGGGTRWRWRIIRV